MLEGVVQLLGEVVTADPPPVVIEAILVFAASQDDQV